MNQSYSFTQKALAMAVHVFTASGIVCGFYALVAISGNHFMEAMYLLIACQIIDGIDGTFARLWRVKEVLPWMNGSTIDYVVDFCTYAVIPIFLIYQADLMPSMLLTHIACVCMLLVSAIYYGKDGMVSEDNYFVGFPVLWNLAAFWLYFVNGPELAWYNFSLVIILSVLHFVPLKFSYPSRRNQFFYVDLLATVTLLVSSAWIIYNCASGQEFLSSISSEQVAMIWPYIDSDVWQKRFRDYAADQSFVADALTQAGF